MNFFEPDALEAAAPLGCPCWRAPPDMALVWDGAIARFVRAASPRPRERVAVVGFPPQFNPVVILSARFAPGVSSISPLGPLSVGRLVLWGAQFFSCGALHAAAGCAASAGSCPVTQMWPGCVILNPAVLDKTDLLRENVLRWNTTEYNEMGLFWKFPRETRGPEISGQNCEQQFIKHDFVNLQCVLNAVIAQLVEHKIANLRVPSSTLGRRCDLSTAITLGKLNQPETTQLFFFFFLAEWPTERHPRHPRRRRRLSLSLFFFSFSFRDAEVLWARLRVVCWSVRRIWMEEEGRHLSFHFLF